jgi:phosphoribosylcarboxyaminoimidazole (NCAIR) mutase
MNANEWLADYAERLGTTPPSPEDFRVILALAGIAAHASERVAAPAACWVAANAGVPLEEALRVGKEVGQ